MGEIRILEGDVLERLRELPAQSVHAVVTSPPYYGLRDYKIPASIWGGKAACKHSWSTSTRHVEFDVESGVCRKCGAWRGKLGLEPVIGLYLEHLAQVFAELWRVLRDDGTLWVNMGDAYNAGSASERRPSNPDMRGGGKWRYSKHGYWSNPAITKRVTSAGSKRKDMLGVPWALAFSLRDQGWYLRRDIIWSKPNSMPESATDRPSNAHEYIFLFSKRPKYYFDWVAVLEPVTGTAHARGQGVTPKSVAAGEHSNMSRLHQNASTLTRRIRQNDSWSAANRYLVSMRRMRDVWEFATTPWSGDHFATFPVELPRRAILAATSEQGCCPACGAPYRRRIARKHYGDWSRDPSLKAAGVNTNAKWRQTEPHSSGRRMVESLAAARLAGGAHDSPFRAPVTLGWDPGCQCDAGPPVPATILDPFAGTGTTLVAAELAGRSGLGIELSAADCQAARKRLKEARERRVFGKATPPDQMPLFGLE